MALDQIIPVLQLAVGPVIVISGVGLVLLLMTNRYARVIDRSRNLAEALRKVDYDETHRYFKQLIILGKRASRLRTAITFATISTLMAPLFIIALFCIALFDLKATWLIILVFITCMGALVIGLILFLLDVNVSLSALKLETTLQENKKS